MNYKFKFHGEINFKSTKHIKLPWSNWNHVYKKYHPCDITIFYKHATKNVKIFTTLKWSIVYKIYITENTKKEKTYNIHDIVNYTGELWGYINIDIIMWYDFLTSFRHPFSIQFCLCQSRPSEHLPTVLHHAQEKLISSLLHAKQVLAVLHAEKKNSTWKVFNIISCRTTSR